MFAICQENDGIFAYVKVPKRTERGHLEAVLEGAGDNCIEDSPINIIPQTPSVNDPKVKAFERYRVQNCQGMKVIQKILSNGYVRVQVPEADINVVYNPLSTSTDKWKNNWFLQKGAIWK